MTEAPSQALTWAIATAITLGGAGLLALLVYGVAALRTKAKGSAFELAVAVVDEAVTGVAVRVRLELLPALVLATAPDSPGGRAITPEERGQLLERAVAILRADLAAPVLKALTVMLGAGVNAWLKGKVEGAIVAQAAEALPKPLP